MRQKLASSAGAQKLEAINEWYNTVFMGRLLIGLRGAKPLRVVEPSGRQPVKLLVAT